MLSAEPAAGASLDMGTAGLKGRHVLEIASVRELSGRSDLQGILRFGTHLLVIGLTGLLLWLSMPRWYLVLPAMVLHGFAIVTMFAPMHECVHRTAFDNRRLNEICGWIAGLLSFYNFTYYRYYHTWHHRYTQDPERDPELATPKPQTVFEYVLEISGLTFWLYRPGLFVRLAMGRTASEPFVPANSRRKIAVSASLQLSIYLAGIAAAFAGYPYFVLYWLLPAIAGQPLLRAILIAEHTGCSQDEDGLTNTRTTMASWPVRLLMWNMPYHTEHHLYPSIPFHHLPEAHVQLKQKLVHLAPSYPAANREIVRGLGDVRSTPT